jgi:hypothetical protein
MHQLFIFTQYSSSLEVIIAAAAGWEQFKEWPNYTNVHASSDTTPSINIPQPLARQYQ